MKSFNATLMLVRENKRAVASARETHFTERTMSAGPKLHFTPEEYLAMEIPAEYKSQYIAGEIFAMAGAEPWHAKSPAIVVALGSQLRGRPCEEYSQYAGADRGGERCTPTRRVRAVRRAGSTSPRTIRKPAQSPGDFRGALAQHGSF